MQPYSNNPPRVKRRRAASFVFPLLLVVVGVVLLLNNVGVVPWAIWTSIGRLWPVILILFGLDLLLGRRSAWFGLTIAAIMLFAVFGAGLWMTHTESSLAAAPIATEPQSAVVPLDGASSGQVTVQIGAGVLHLGSPPSNPDSLAEASGELPSGAQLKNHATTRNGVADVAFSTAGAMNFWPFGSVNQSHANTNLDVLLSPKVPLTLNADVGAGDSTFDLSGLQVRNFSLNNGAGQASVTFPTSAGQTTADIHSGAGSLSLTIPEGVGARIHASNGLVNLHVATDRFKLVGDYYQTDDYNSATNRVDITLHVGIGEVDVQ
jgi:hypothetical protein